MKKSIIVSILFVVLFTACRKEPVELINPNMRFKNCKTYVQQFEAVWEGMDQGYMYWEVDTVDWDARYEKYLPVFQDFDSRPANHPVNPREYKNAWKGLFAGLTDHHLFVRCWNPKQQFDTEYEVNPGSDEVHSRDYYHWTDSYTQLKVLKNMEGVEKFFGFDGASYGTINFPMSYSCQLPGKTEDKKIAYLRFSSFQFSEALYYMEYLNESDRGKYQHAFYNFFGNYTLSGVTGKGWPNSDEVEALIIDVRGNNGGSTADLNALIGCLAQQRTHVGYTRVKEGVGRLDYSAWTPYYVHCPGNHMKEAKPIVVLADVNSVSCAELATMLIKNLPNGIFIGERTFGATGALLSNSESSHDLFYNGCFGDPDYYTYGEPSYPHVFDYYVYTSTYHFVNVNKEAVEGIGVIPDIEVKYNEEHLYQGIDDQLNRALEYLRTGK